MQKPAPCYSLTKRLSTTKYGDDRKTFGVVNLEVDRCDSHVPKTQHFILTVDRSGSMAAREKDGMTKMQHVIHTISNMLRYFAYDIDSTEVFISVIIFDNKVECIIDKISINKENVKQLVEKVEEIYPRDMTDMGAAIRAANEQKNSFSQDAKHTHILLTDGKPTSGVTDKDKLGAILDQSYKNILIGYGVDHNMELMMELGGNDARNYYFVESAENAGNVYGEIIYGVLNEAMTEVAMESDDLEFYNWKTDEWVRRLELGSLSYGTEKLYHIRAIPDQHDIENVLCITVSYMFGLTERKDVVPVATKEFGTPFDVTKYIYRQKTLELLFMAADYKANPITVTDNISELMESISREIETAPELEDETGKNFIFMQNLRDDLYVAKRSLASRYGQLYLGARMISQGDQRAYNVKNLEAMCPTFVDFDMASQDIDGPLPPLGAIDRTCPAGNYRMSSQEASPYASTEQRYLMRQCSQDPSPL